MFDSLSIKIKYSIPLFIALLALITVMFANQLLTNKLEQSAEVFPDSFIPAISAVLNADRDLYQARVAEVELVNSAANAGDLVATIEENAQQAKQRFNQYRDLMAAYPDVLASLQGFERAYDVWERNVQQVISLAASDRLQEARSLAQGASVESFAELRDLYDLAGESAFTKAELLKKQIRDSNAGYKTVALIVTISVLLLSIITAVYSQKLLLQRLQEIKNGINEITSGGGDLTQKIAIKQRDEIGELGQAFNEFIESLHGLISQVRQEVVQLSSSREQLMLSANSGLAVADKQSSASDMIVSAVHQMSMSTKELADIASTTADETKSAMVKAQQGSEKIKESVLEIDHLYGSIENAAQGSKKLSEDSNNISGVLDVIRGVAEQTNLLALNAAIEAARAGEQGRGFAVVADEVRSLAQKTQESTDSIQVMIEALQAGVGDVVNQIEDGFNKVSSTVNLIRETEQSLERILASISTVSDMTTQTAAATEEQTAVTDDINKNLHSLNEQIYRTKEIATDTSDASTQVHQLANEIELAVGRFKVETS
ncbi:HAMP domain-containing protein [Shewanella sp. Scap07]|uniref:methyl-accepting chemotaxis protein n=1 Tax=Shewanella sp. Scap07 TaxID=2589987 RepID=UPI0015BE8F49|nr:methyl-accepting chemotaxis protein [Shewanella sp. Scap07]QLE87025.1 HAMP domain-containing protein [Shewanella sp. Scap07]